MTKTTGEKVREAVYEIAKRGGVDNLRDAQSEDALTGALPCEHPSGFLFMRRISKDWEPWKDLFYCSRCNARRVVNHEGNVTAATEGKGWS